MKREFRGKDRVGQWTLLSKINSGSNGEVWICSNDSGEKRAIKLLKKDHSTAFQRFTDEVNTIEGNQDIKGVIPIIESYLPDDYKGEISYYIMPIGDSFEKKIKDKEFNYKIEVVIKIAESLANLHSRGIVHRDIKPANLLFIGDEPFLIDFGLVDFPDKKEVSKRKEKIGPRWTMAPEINRHSGEEIDYFKSDVYSMAKTLWIILTDIQIGFEGQYNVDTILQLRNKYHTEYTTPIDKLLTNCTDNDPIIRPSIEQFLHSLYAWRQLNGNFHLRNNQQWAEILNKLFPVSVPKRVIWEDLDEIIQILKILGSVQSLNHLFFPDTGGLDLIDARRSIEEGCIELDFDSIYIVKPIKLIFESFGADPSWNYFRLETGGLNSSGVYTNNEFESSIYEPLAELHPGQYANHEILQNMDYHKEGGLDIPDTARFVTRYFKGAFVIFNKRSRYNLESSTYDARHNKMTTDEFRDYIHGCIS